jgi:hypothetical protein
MTMTPTEFRDRLAAELAHAPGSDDVAGDLAAGRRLLRRRRATFAAGAAAVVAAAVAVPVLALGGSPSTRTPVATESPDTTAELVAACRDGNQSERATDAIFGPGTPVVKAQAGTDHRITLVLESADGAYWARCFVNLSRAEFNSGMEVFDAGGRTRDEMYGAGPGCAMGTEDCRTFTVTWVDRRPPAVAAAEFVTGDGVTTTVDSRGGYLVFEYLGTLPDGVESDPDMGIQGGFDPIRRITFLDAAGTPIAAAAHDGSGEGPGGERIGDLPTLREYPALRAPQPIY